MYRKRQLYSASTDFFGSRQRDPLLCSGFFLGLGSAISTAFSIRSESIFGLSELEIAFVRVLVCLRSEHFIFPQVSPLRSNSVICGARLTCPRSRRRGLQQKGHVAASQRDAELSVNRSSLGLCRQPSWLYRKLTQVIGEAHHDSNHASTTASLAAKAAATPANWMIGLTNLTSQTDRSSPKSQFQSQRLRLVRIPNGMARVVRKARGRQRQRSVDKGREGEDAESVLPKTGTCLTSCPYLHDANNSNNPHPNPKAGAEAKAKPAAAPKTASAGAFVACSRQC